MNYMIKSYKEAERIGRQDIPNVAIQAFALAWWRSSDYPHEIESSSELWKFHNQMHDGRFDLNATLIGEIDSSLHQTIISTAEILVSYTKSTFGFADCARESFSRAILQFNYLYRLNRDLSSMSILEIGPGNGYLGLLLAIHGVKYYALEACQAFYMYQNSIWNYAFGNSYFDGIKRREEGSETIIEHVPYWNVCNRDFMFPNVTHISANHVISEMNPLAINRICQLIARSKTPPTIVIEGLGYPHIPHHEVKKMFTSQGFHWESYEGGIIDLVTYGNGQQQVELKLDADIEANFKQRVKSKFNRYAKQKEITKPIPCAFISTLFSSLPSVPHAEYLWRAGEW